MARLRVSLPLCQLGLFGEDTVYAVPEAAPGAEHPIPPNRPEVGPNPQPEETIVYTST